MTIQELAHDHPEASYIWCSSTGTHYFRSSDVSRAVEAYRATHANELADFHKEHSYEMPFHILIEKTLREASYEDYSIIYL